MVNVRTLVFLVYSFQFVNGEAVESSTVSTSSQEAAIPDESQARTISAELRECGIRITGPGLKWEKEKVDDCSTAYADPPEIPKIYGQAGALGKQGLMGEKGKRGLEGEKGDKGPIGEGGSGGEKGDRGSTGLKGAKGDQMDITI
ncbi:collagen alpha-1(XI) chain-like isoform X2 [Pieris napi]|uniref:collagen alpha-1(XI) chain-like isoform X2 n=1 Tax=Pieris napi TaxID=78633 RepID=UPI001FBAE076|nr:collagen alpha-1(XI) chain-like isoform X2 [Pieris napi]